MPSVGYGIPYIDRKCIETLFQFLSIDNIILLFKRVLLDTSNLFISEKSGRLVDCCEAIKSLIFPFKYEQVYIPNLPEGLRDRVDCPYIFMMGMVKDEYVKTKDSIKDGTYIIDIDKDYIFQVPHTSITLKRTGTNNNIALEDLPDLPSTLLKRLKKEIEGYSK